MSEAAELHRAGNSLAGVEDYYAGHGEAPGRWIGSAAAEVRLSGEVDGDSLRSVLEGRLPGSESPLGRAGANRTPGWDLTWSAPKSVSVLYGLTDDLTSREVTGAHDAAVKAGMEYLTRWGLTSRRRVDGEVAHVEGRGIIAAGFRHRTSRALDPQLHTHALVANAVERADGTWGAIDSRTLYRHAKTAGFVYQAVLRSELTHRIGVEWGEVRNGVAEATIVPKQVRELFSTRRREIEAELDARGASSMKSSRVAALRTRDAKGEISDTNVLRSEWRTKMADAGLEIDPHGRLPERSVLVVDEAGMVNTRKLGEMVSWMQPDTKLVLIGDHKQLPEIGAGGVLRGISERVEVPQLLENRRQHDVDERGALAELREGDIGRAVSWYEDAGRLIAVDNMDEARASVLDTWWNDRLDDGVDGVQVDQLLMAERRTDVARLNELARERHEAAGLRGARRLEIGDLEFATGDVVMFTRNDTLIGVRNGERGVVTDVGRDELVVDVDGEARQIPRDYLAGGHVDYGWAATVHKNQGATCDRAYLVASDSLYREMGYVALSRGREDNRIWTVAELDDDPEINEPHSPTEERNISPVGQLIAAMERSSAQQLAIDEATELDHDPGPKPVDVDELMARRDDIGRSLFLHAPERVSDSVTAAEERVIHAETRLEAASDDRWATAYESLIEAREQLDQYAARQARFDQWVSEHRDPLSEYRQLDRQVTTALREQVVDVETDPPAHLLDAIGYPPAGVDARQEWRDVAVELERQQLRQHLNDDVESRLAGSEVLELL